MKSTTYERMGKKTTKKTNSWLSFYQRVYESAWLGRFGVPKTGRTWAGRDLGIPESADLRSLVDERHAAA
jgi:hypothetical protein